MDNEIDTLGPCQESRGYIWGCKRFSEGQCWRIEWENKTKATIYGLGCRLWMQPQSDTLLEGFGFGAKGFWAYGCGYEPAGRS